MQAPCAVDAPERDGSGHGDCTGCESELMCTPGTGLPVLHISWAVSGTSAPAGKRLPLGSPLPQRDTIPQGGIALPGENAKCHEVHSPEGD